MGEVAPARTLGPYKLEILLGRGGMGEVFQAYDARLDRRVAIKHIHPEALEKQAYRARFRREARAIARLNHPAIVQIFDLLEDDDGEWIVMELLEGATLAETIRHGQLPLERTLAWSRKIAEGLAEAHARGVVHRDLKAENVMVLGNGHVKILDFGLAKQIALGEDSQTLGETSISVTGQVLGTGRSMSPEQARGLAIDHRSDLFALGTLLYEMLTGTSPFRGDTLADTLSLVLTHRPAPVCQLNTRVPRALSELVAQLHEKPPELRPTSARTVVDRLAAIAGAVPTSSESVDDATTIAGPMAPITAVPEGTVAPATSLDRPEDNSRARNGLLRHGRWPSLALMGMMVLAAISAVIWISDPLLVHSKESATEATSPPADSVSATAGMSALSEHELYARGTEAVRLFHRDGNLDRAIDAFQRLLARDADSAAAHAGLARTYWRKYRTSNKDPSFLEQAQHAAERAVELDQYLTEAYVSRGLVYTYLGRVEEARGDFEAALRLEPTDADAHCGLGEVAEREKDFPAAEAAYRRAIELRPEDRTLHDRLGTLFYRRGRYEEAEQAFRASTSLAPDSIFSLRNLASIYYLQGRYHEAAEQIQKALKIRRSNTLYSSLGTISFNQGLYQDAVTAFKQALELGGASHDYLYWANLADAYRWTPDNEEASKQAYGQAIELVREKLSLEPSDATLRSRLALYHAKRSDHEAALEEVKRIDLAVGQAPYVLYRAVVTHEICGQRAAALKLLELALQRNFPLAEVKRDPELVGLRGDPRYRKVIAAADHDAS